MGGGLMSYQMTGDGQHKADQRICSLCGRPFFGFGNNPEPLKRFEQRCCDECNRTRVVPVRMVRMQAGLDPRAEEEKS